MNARLSTSTPSSTQPSAVITALQPSVQHTRRVVVKVNGRLMATLSIKLAEQLQLHVGMHWSAALAEQVRAAAAFDKALTTASRWVNRRPLSKSRIIERMQKQNWSSELREQVIARMEQLRLIDDAALGRQLLDQWARRRPAWSALLQQKLSAQGLPESLIAELLAEQAAQTDPLTLAMELVEKKVRAMRGLTPLQQRRRLYGLLARRGFDESIITRVIAKCVVCSEADESF